MSEVNLSALAESGEGHLEAKLPTPMQEINLALKACKFGRFHIRLLCSAFCSIAATVSITSTTSYLLPIAECDLNMDLLQKGLLNAAPYIGMVTSSVVAGFLTDALGRKIFIITGYTGEFLFCLVSGSSQVYEVLLMSKFFEGFFLAMSLSATLTLTSEFCHSGIRDRMMVCQSSCQALSQVVVAILSWGILSQEWEYTLFNGYFVLHIWNFYLYIMAIWPVTVVMFYYFIPESPKFYLSQQRYDDARNILVRMYVENTGQPAETYEYINLWKDRMKQKLDETDELPKAGISHQIVTALYNVKPMFRKPLVIYMLLICTMNFIIMCLMNIVRLWFPQISTIVEHYSSGSEDFCEMLDRYTSDQVIRVSEANATDVCVPVTSGTETYINSIILGFVGIIPYLVSGVLVNKVGKKCMIIAAAVIAVATNIAMRWANSKVAVVSLFALDLSVGQVMMSLVQATTVEVFPTTTRTLAISLAMLTGRIGTLLGNVFFPILLNIGCSVPFYTLSSMMICVVIIAFFLPTKKK